MAGEPTPVGVHSGDEVEVTVGAWAHGGHCVARHRGLVIFVRHTLPGERVRVRIDRVRKKLAFGDAITILDAAPDRVEAPCRFAGPGGCGGCDFQHVSLAAQRGAKTAVVVEQLTRLGRLAADNPVFAGFGVESVPGDRDGLGWRTRVQFTIDGRGSAGLRRHHSHEVVPIDRCLIAHPGVDALGITALDWAGRQRVEGVVSASGDRLILETPSTAKPARVRERVAAPDGEIELQVTGSGFWQVHPGAAGVLSRTVIEQLQPHPGDVVFDLYAGVGLFSAVLAPLVGVTGRVVAVESDAGACRDARRNLRDYSQVRVETGRVERVLADLGRADLVVLDPPRAGAGAAVLEAVVAARPRAISYVACDPAALARDTAMLHEAGYALSSVRAFDLFPMTHHVECVARFELEDRP